MLARGLQDLITFELVDYRDFAEQHPGEFDRIISCEMVSDVALQHHTHELSSIVSHPLNYSPEKKTEREGKSAKNKNAPLRFIFAIFSQFSRANILYQPAC